MAESTVVRTKRDTIIAHIDSGASQTYTVAYEPGDFSWDVPREDVLLFRDRGIINGGAGSTPSIRKGDEQPVTFSYTAYLRSVGTAGTSDNTLPDIGIRFASKQVATNWTSTLGNNGDPFTVTTTAVYDGTAFGESDLTVTFAYCTVRVGISDGDPSTTAVTGTSWALIPTIA